MTAKEKMMNESASIEKNRKLKNSQDYYFLREKGIEHLQNLASKIWPDHNVHDPGVTMLEDLCYAISDLGYRTGYEIKDIFAEGTALSNACKKEFFTAREILTCNPVTINDFRKLFIDVPGVKNSWLNIEENVEPKIYVDCDKSKLTLSNTGNLDALKLDGLYNIKIELDDNPEAGDLTVYNFSKTVVQNGSTITLETDVYLKWDLLYKINAKPESIVNIEFLVEKYSQSTKLYSGKLILQFTDYDIYLPFTTITRIKGAGLNIDIAFVQNELNDTSNDFLSNVSYKIKSKLSRALEIAKEVYSTFHSHRNLCEDYYSLTGSKLIELAVCADLEIDGNADIDEIFAQLFYKLTESITPAINFYTLEEMLEKKGTPDKVFNGPILNHGFIDEDELGEPGETRTIHYSDIIRVLMSVPEVKAVKNLLLTNIVDGIPLSNNNEEWKLDISEGTAVRITINRSKIILYKGLLPYSANKSELKARLKELIEQNRNNKLEKGDYDIDIPKGNDQEIQTYSSVQNDYPLTYGIGAPGLPGSATGLRKAQAKQLKAFLLFYDQMLANYLAQLAHVKDLFSLDEEIQKTYFTRAFFEIPNYYNITETNLSQLIDEELRTEVWVVLAELVDDNLLTEDELMQHIADAGITDLSFDEKELILACTKVPGVPKPIIYNESNLFNEFVESDAVKNNAEIDLDKFSTYKTEWQQYASDKMNERLEVIFVNEEKIESDKKYYIRKNKFLDHLMARFNEQFTEYVLLMRTLTDTDASQRLIEDKLSFLNNYPAISRERGKAFNYKEYDDSPTNETQNISGLQKRVSGLMGVHTAYQKYFVDTLSDYFEYTSDSGGVKFKLLDEDENTLLISPKNYEDLNTAKDVAREVEEFGWQKTNYEKHTTGSGKLRIRLKNESDEIIARSNTLFDNEADYETELDKIVLFISGRTNYEGFHLIEHILLRPFEYNQPINGILSSFEIYQEKDKDGIDEYRFRLINEEKKILLSSSTRYYSTDDAMKEINEVIKYGDKKDNYKIKINKLNKFYFNLVDDTGEVIARRIDDFETDKECKQAIEETVLFFKEYSSELNNTDYASLFTVCIEKGCKSCLGFIDPYSFRATAVVPAWLPRFQNMDFRRLFEKTLRLEAPAHVHLKICWVSRDDMRNFENSYYLWLKEKAKDVPDESSLFVYQSQLIRVMESLRSVYPVSILFDCGDTADENPILLDHSVLGTTKKDENESV